MSTIRLMVFATVVMGLASCGCERLNVALNYHEPRPVYRSHIDVGHICTDGCLDHYYNGSEVVVLRGHRHGHGCGHYWDGSHWGVTVSRGHAPAVHVCGPRCHNHFWNGSRLVVLGSGHHHNDSCGHQWDGRHWVVVSRTRHHNDVHVDVAPRVHVTTTHHHGPACGCVYDRSGSKWVKVSAGHIHGAGCGHVHRDGRWSVTIESPNNENRVKIHPRKIKRGN